MKKSCSQRRLNNWELSPAPPNFGRISNRKKYVVVIAGPTAVGKTALAIEVAKYFGTVIISADSRQLYRGLDIGTAKPSSRELDEVTHYFIDTREPDELYGAGHFAAEARALLEQLFSKHDVVVIAGGSGLYIDALLHGLDEFGDVPAEVRENLNSKYQSKGIEWLRESVRKADPVFYSGCDPSNPQRMLRALEVYEHTGVPFSEFRKGRQAKKEFTVIPVLLNLPREKLYERINARVDNMMRQGFLEEVRSLRDRRQLNALRTVGYRELFDHLEGKCTLDEAVTKIKQHTRNYAKRQLTWFRNRGEYTEFEPGDSESVIRFIREKM